VLFLAAVLVFTNLNSAFADGSKDLYPTGVSGNRAFLYSSANTFGAEAYPFKTAGTHYVYAVAGELIGVASSAQGRGQGTINIFAPNNVTPGTPSATSGNSTTTGRISNRAQEETGPYNLTGALPAGRYRPFEYIAPVTGIYRVEFIPPAGLTGNNLTTGGRADILADDDWTQDATNENSTNGATMIAAWDVSVRANTNNSAWIPGRTYVNVLNLLIDGSFTNNTGFKSSVYVLTKDGRAYLVNNNDNKGIGFTFFVNNKGFKDGANNSSYKSVNSNLITGVTQDPRVQDGATDITHKIFYTKPDASLPTTASINYSGTAQTTTWLKTVANISVISNVSLTGNEGTVGQAGTKGGKITFNSNNAGTYKIVIPPSNGVERVLTGAANVGMNTVNWDGKDGAGNSLAPGTTVSQIRVRLQTAEVHFPFIDMEVNPKGLIIELLPNGTGYTVDRTNTDIGQYSDLVFWNDSLITRAAGDERSAPLASGTNGIASTGNGHKWGSYSADAGAVNTNTGKGANSFGNLRSMDTWAFTQSPEATTNVSVVTTVADLRTNSITPSFSSPVAVGSTVSYTVVVENFRNTDPAVNSVSDITGAGFNFTAPAGFTITNVSRTLETNVSETNPVTSGSTYNSKLNMNSGTKATFVITGTVGTALAGKTIPVQASMLRPADTTDPDATNSTSGLPPTDPAAECSSVSSNSSKITAARPYGCNNIYADNSIAVVNYVSVSTATPTVTEGGTAGSYTFTIQNASANPTVINYSMSGNASNGTDYTIATTATIPANATSVTIPFTVIDDNVAEGSESATLTLTSANNGITVTPVVASQSATITINDNDVATVAITPTVSVNEANGPATFTVTLTGAVQNAFTVSYSTANGTATAGSDYTGATNATVSFPANSASGATQQISIPIINDNIAEADETFTVNLTGTSIGTQVTIPAATATGTATIVDNDRPVATLSGDATVTEGTNTVANYTVTLTGAANTTLSTAVTVPITAVAGTAFATSDYSNVPANVTFAAGTVLNASGIATQPFTITIVNDLISEPVENFTVNIGTPGGPASLGAAANTSVITTINDNDVATVAITPIVSVNEANGPATFTVTLTGAVQNAFTVTYSTANGTATAGSDYTGATNATVSFPANSASGATQQISIPIINDNIAEADETFTVNLTGTSIGTQMTIPAATATGTATIVTTTVRLPH
jgi:hypothetical protein